MQRPEKGWDRSTRGVFRSIFDPKGIVATPGSRKSISTNSPGSHSKILSPQHPKMLALRLSFCISLLLLSPIIYAAKVDIKDVIKLAREEVLLEASCKDMYYLRELVQKRMERFYTAVYTFIIADPPGTISKRGRSYLENVEEMISCVDLPPKAPTSPTTRRFPVVLVENEPVQGCYIISVVDLSTPKASSPAVLQAWKVAISKLKKTMDASIMPLLQPPVISFDSLESVF